MSGVMWRTAQEPARPDRSARQVLPRRALPAARDTVEQEAQGQAQGGEEREDQDTKWAAVIILGVVPRPQLRGHAVQDGDNRVGEKKNGQQTESGRGASQRIH